MDKVVICQNSICIRREEERLNAACARLNEVTRDLLERGLISDLSYGAYVLTPRVLIEAATERYKKEMAAVSTLAGMGSPALSYMEKAITDICAPLERIDKSTLSRLEYHKTTWRVKPDSLQRLIDGYTIYVNADNEDFYTLCLNAVNAVNAVRDALKSARLNTSIGTIGLTNENAIQIEVGGEVTVNPFAVDRYGRFTRIDREKKAEKEKKQEQEQIIDVEL